MSSAVRLGRERLQRFGLRKTLKLGTMLLSKSLTRRKFRRTDWLNRPPPPPPSAVSKRMASLARAAASAARSALRPAPLAGRARSSPLPSLASPSPARILRRSAAAGLETLMPLHSAAAAARLRSCIAVDSSCWSSLSQEEVAAGGTPLGDV